MDYNIVFIDFRIPFEFKLLDMTEHPIHAGTLQHSLSDHRFIKAVYLYQL